jgi:nicotinate phosphoribosyltransferase
MEEITRAGDVVYNLPSLEMIRQTRARDMDRLYPGVKRIMNPHEYHVSLTKKLWDLKQSLVHDLADGIEDNH